MDGRHLRAINSDLELGLRRFFPPRDTWRDEGSLNRVNPIMLGEMLQHSLLRILSVFKIYIYSSQEKNFSKTAIEIATSLPGHQNKILISIF